MTETPLYSRTILCSENFIPSLFTRATAGLSLCGAAIVATSLGVAMPRGDTLLAVDNLPLVGSLGGNSFTRDCPVNHVLTGVRFRHGFVLDAIGIKCRPVRSDGTLGPEINSGSMAGGAGGTAGSESCPGSVVVSQVGASAATRHERRELLKVRPGA